MKPVSTRVLVLNVILAGLAVFLAVSLVRDLTHARPLPASSAARRAQAPVPAEEPAEPAIAGETLGAYNVIVAKHLFNPSRSEATAAAAAPTLPPPVKPMLLGVVVDGPNSRAYLEDPGNKRVFGYQLGDTVAGGRLDQITDDKVTIVRPDGAVEVLLRDPSKPRPAPPTAGAPGSTPQASAPPRPESPSGPGRPPAPPRATRRLPTDQPQEPQRQ